MEYSPPWEANSRLASQEGLVFSAR